MNAAQNCIFCGIVAREAPAHIIWEDEKHLAFLSIFPNTEGFSVVIPKIHYSSYLFDQPDDVVRDLVLASGRVAKLLDSRLTDVGRTGVIFEGFGVDHLHAKLFPMHGTDRSEWTQRKANLNKYFEQYEGYISSHDFKRADDSLLAELARQLRG